MRPGPACSRYGVVAALLACAASAAQPITITDDRGKAVALAVPAQRIVTLAPSLAELVFAAGAGGKLVGVARDTDFPPAARGLPQVGDAARVEFERVLLLKPDLVLAWKSGNPAGDVERIERLGIPVFITEPTRLGDIPRLLRALGALAATDPPAERAASEFTNNINRLSKEFAGRARLRVFYQIWHKPLLTVNGAHIISDVIALCGGENIFADVAQLTPNVTLEAVITARPEVVLGGGSTGGEQALVSQWRESPVGELRKLPVFYIDPDLIQRQTPRIVDGAKAVCAALDKVRSRHR